LSGKGVLTISCHYGGDIFATHLATALYTTDDLTLRQKERDPAPTA